MLESGQNVESLSAIPIPYIQINPSHVRTQLENLSHTPSSELSTERLSQILSHCDLTTLSATDSRERIAWLSSKIKKLNKTISELSPLAGFCIPGDNVQIAEEILRNSSTRIATVINFPLGQSPLPSVLTETKIRLEQGAEEIDLVFPLARYLSGENHSSLVHFVLQIKNLCREYNAYLKTIIQTDELEHDSDPFHPVALSRIAEVASLAYAGCSDMIKTSTGKGTGGATLSAAAVMIQVAKAFAEDSPYISSLQHSPGIKYSGGIRTPSEAYAFMELQAQQLPQEPLTLTTLRFGTSRLVTEVLATLNERDDSTARALYNAGIDRNFFTVNTDSNY